MKVSGLQNCQEPAWLTSLFLTSVHGAVNVMKAIDQIWLRRHEKSARFREIGPRKKKAVLSVRA